MCGRFIQCAAGEHLAERFQLATPPALVPRYNVAPGQPIGAVRIAGAGGREWVTLRWGLVPAWAPEPKTSYSTINARAETAADKPAFRQAFRRRRGPRRAVPASRPAGPDAPLQRRPRSTDRRGPDRRGRQPGMGVAALGPGAGLGAGTENFV